MNGSSLTGRRVIITRPEPGVLAEHVLAAGAGVIHMPLIGMIDPQDSGVALGQALADCKMGDWVVVTSPEGARRVVDAGLEMLRRDAADAVKVAAVGRATAAIMESITGRPVDLLPTVQLGSALVEEMARLDSGQRVLVVHGDLADPALAVALRAQGHHVETVVAYRTVSQTPTADQRSAAREADAVVLASGSAARSWAEHCGDIHPPVICAIGPSTAAVARECGITVTHQADESSVEGIMVCLNQAFDPGHPTMG
jgi:uroporphyrinogen-III synthase